MKYCIECEYFHTLDEPIKHNGYVYDSGHAKCEKYNKIIEYISKDKLKNLGCVLTTELSQKWLVCLRDGEQRIIEATNLSEIESTFNMSDVIAILRQM